LIVASQPRRRSQIISGIPGHIGTCVCPGDGWQAAWPANRYAVPRQRPGRPAELSQVAQHAFPTPSIRIDTSIMASRTVASGFSRTGRSPPEGGPHEAMYVFQRRV